MGRLIQMEDQMYEIVGMGSALLDFQAEVSEDVLNQLGVKKAGMTLVDPHYQLEVLTRLREEFAVKNIQVSSGGSAVNTLAGYANFGGKALLIAKMGNDENGQSYLSDLKNNGIAFHGELTPEKMTGTCLALITPDAERSMLTSLAVAVELGPDDLQTEEIKKAKVLYMEGYLWDSPTARKACLEAIEIARANNTKVAFTFSDAFCVNRHLQDFVQLAQNKLDILFCNEHEALAATKCSRIEDAFAEMKSWCDKTFISVGAKGALASEHRGASTCEVPTWDCKLVDKLGAGDLFASGVLHGIIQNRTMKESAYLGCYAATRVIQQMSARLIESLQPHIEEAVKGPGARAAIA